ncbi:DUF2790 domain-containing protein [Pseudomonas sp. SIMBA_077]
MKRLIAFALMGLSTLAMADGPNVTPSQPAVEHYTYATDLDIAKVINLSPVEDVCAVVPAKMTYEDHQGKRHVLEYSVMGNGCTNG